MKIKIEKQKQTITFEPPELPGQIFRITMPEIVSDAKEVIVPWSQPSPNWVVTDTCASWSAEVPDNFRMEAEVLFQGEQILTRVSLTNLSDRIWEMVNPFTCFAFWEAPLFDDPQLSRIYLPVGEGWKPVGDLFKEYNPGERPYTFFPVQGGPALADLWLCRTIPQWHQQMVSTGAGCVVSQDGKWVAGMSTQHPAFVFVNRQERCIHANPLISKVAPGETVEGSSVIHIFRGGLEDFSKRIQVS